MASVYILNKDLTGEAAANFISEVHAPQAGKRRIIIPRFGDFYNNSKLKLFDASTNTELSKDLWRPRDLQEEKTLQSIGGEVYSLLELKENTPASIRVEAQHFGGEDSLSAVNVLHWIEEHLANSPASVNYKDLLNVPKDWNPKHHKHLLAHIYWMNPLVRSLKRVKDAVKIGRRDAIEYARTSIELRLTGLRERATLTIEGMVDLAMQKWRADLDTFHLGLDLLNNLALLDPAQAKEIAAPAFVLSEDAEDKYVDLRFLGSFSKELFQTMTTGGTYLGDRYATLCDPTRGNVLAAKNGEVYMIPAKKDALDSLSKWPWVWPENYPEAATFVIMKVIGNEKDLGGIFQGFNPLNGDSWLGILSYEEYAFRLVWLADYNENSTINFQKVLDEHAAKVGVVHQETAHLVGLGNLEGRGVVNVDEVLSRTKTDNLHTVASFLYLLRAAMEGVELPLGENGQVDLEKNPMLQPKIIYAPCETKDYSINTPEKTWCDNGVLWGRFKDATGVLHDVEIEKANAGCINANVPVKGHSFGQFCDDAKKSMCERFADGNGGTYVDVIYKNDPRCGYVTPDAEGKVLAEYCQDNNRMREIANGDGTKRKVIWYLDYYLCGGTRGEGQTSGTGNGSTGSKTRKIVFASSHTKIYIGTHEMLKAVFYGLEANTSYEAAIWCKTKVAFDNKSTEMLKFNFKTNDKGEYIYELPREDQGITPRGMWDTWIYMESANLESNHVQREFLPGTNPGSGNPDVTLPEDPEPSTGTPPAKDVDGHVIDPDVPQVWPPRPRYNPTLVLTTDKPFIYPNDTEKLTAEATNFMANTSYTLKFFATYPDGRTLMTYQQQVVTDGNGNVTYSIYVFDDGATVPRGDIKSWVEMEDTKSPSLIRTFNTAGSGTSNPDGAVPGLLYSISNSTIGVGTTYTETVIFTKLKSNTKYSMTIKGGYFDGAILGGVRAELVITTDSNGNARWERTLTEQGTTPAATWTITAYAQDGSQTISSNQAFVTFTRVNSSTQPGTGVPKVDYSTNQSVLKKGTTETHTVRLSNATPNTKYTARYYIQSIALNGNQEYMTTARELTTNAQGTGVDTLTNTDDGSTVPRGDYQCWVEIAELKLKSAKITRSFVNEDGSTTPKPVPSNRVVSFSTSHPTIQPGTAETMTVSISGFDPNKTFTARLIIRSDALQNGGQNVQTGEIKITTNAQGDGSNNLTIVDNNQTPRGVYQCWAVVDDVSSNVANRTFIGAPVTYNPVVEYSTSHTTIQKGITERQVITIRDAAPNTRYTLEYWTQSTALQNNLPFRGTFQAVVTDANGFGSIFIDTYDNGDVVPRGLYYSWGVVQETGQKSNTVLRNFIGTPPPVREFYPIVNYWTNQSVLYLGLPETHNYTLGGAMPNTPYTIEFWISGGGIGTLQTKVENVVTDANGTAGGFFVNYDDGVTPRGDYQCWVVLSGYSNVRSNPVNRKFI